MPPVLNDLLASKKFIFTLAVTLLVLVAGHFGALTKPEVMAVLGVLWPVYLGAQGVADVGQKLADGRVVQQEMIGEHEAARSKSVNDVMAIGLPILAQMMSQSYGKGSASVGAPTVMRALPKGCRVISLQQGPGKPYECMDDVPEMGFGESVTFVVHLRADGVDSTALRADLVFVPPGTTLPEEPKAETSKPDPKKPS